MRAKLTVLGTCLLAMVAFARTIDFSPTEERIKPVNAVGQPPMLGGPNNFTMMHYLKEAGVPYARLHDVGGWLGKGLWVDIPNLFPDFEADENDPKSYVFDFTDALLKSLVDNGVEPYFRLGVTIENFAGQGFAPRRILPPKDPAKWARICEHVILHYTEGWANGFRHCITYWEIWNEPENYESIEKNCMWRGDFESYCDFYGTVAPYLKSKFPDLKIGGYGSCGFYAAAGSANVKAANSSPRMQYFVDCAERFLSRAQQERWPLDFFSYHSYSAPAEALRQVRAADALLNRHGFTADRTERHFNEWLPAPSHEALGTAKQAARIAAELIGLQNSPCDLACIYDARCGLGNYSSLFNPLTYKPHKAYYAFMAFNELRKLGTAVRLPPVSEGLWACAATDGKGRAAILLANDGEQSVAWTHDFGDWRIIRARVTDAGRTYELTAFPSEIRPDSFWLLELEKGEAAELALAERGRAAQYAVVLPDDPSPSQVTAAKELVRYVDEMTGVRLAVETNTTPACGIFLGKGASDLGSDGFRLRADPPHFRIEGGRIRGTLFGVYDFLERYCGCEWLSPTTSDIPKKDRLAVPATLDDVQRPAFGLRDMNWTDQLADWTFTAKLKMNGFRTIYPDSLGGQNHAKDKTTGGSVFDSLCPPSKYFKDHPDWFALVEGKRRSERVQRCLTNAGFLDFLTAQMRERLKKDYPRCKYYSIYPNDFKRNCECADCKALDEREGTPMASLLHMANTVAERIAPDYPDVNIITFAYLYTLKPPKTMKVHSNVMICYCTDAVDFSKPILKSKWKGNRAFAENFRDWRQLTDKLYIWDYSANFKYLFQPFECCHVMPENFRYFRDTGVVGVFEEGDHYGVHCVDEALKTWIIAHLLWNPDQSLDPLLDRFFKGYYGAAAEVARGYYDALVGLEKKRDETKAPLLMWGTQLQDVYQPREFFDEWSAKWTAALGRVQGDPVRRENVYWARHNVDLVRLVRSTCAAKHSLESEVRADGEQARLEPVARRVLADFARVKGLNGFRDRQLVRSRVEAIIPRPESVKERAAGRFVVPASELLIDENLKVTRVDDNAAAGGKAIRIDATSKDGMHHCISFREDAFAKDGGMKIGVRVHARVERTGVATGAAFAVGTCDLVRYAKRDILHAKIDISRVTGDGYSWYDIDGTWRPAGNETLWIGNGPRKGEVNPCIRAVYVDQIELYRK